MLELIEAKPLPEACRQCPDGFCDECEHMMERWRFSPKDVRRLERKARERTIARLQREQGQTRD